MLVAATPFPANAHKCTIKKLKAVAKKEYGLLVCSSKAVKIGDPSILDACVAKVKTKFAASFANAETCVGLAEDCEAIVDESCIPALLRRPCSRRRRCTRRYRARTAAVAAAVATTAVVVAAPSVDPASASWSLAAAARATPRRTRPR
jgi:hypothetical protein